MAAYAGQFRRINLLTTCQSDMWGADLGNAELAVLDRHGEGVDVEIRQDSLALILAGEPINEPMAAARSS